MHRMGGAAAVVEWQNRTYRHLLLRHQPVACGLTAAATSDCDVHLGRCGRLVPRHDPSRRYPLDLLGELVRHAGVKTVQYGLGERGPRSAASGLWVCGDETLSEEKLA